MSYIYPRYLIGYNPLNEIIMKNKKLLWMVLPFVAGAIFGISLLGLISHANQSKASAPDPVVTRINITDAHAFCQNYSRVATAYTSKMNGFTVDKAELTVMNTILGLTPSAAGFRLYFGNDASGTGLMIICGIDASGADLTGNIYSATKSKVGPCPPFCDVNSPIPGQ
jgi:hypothetical protein